MRSSSNVKNGNHRQSGGDPAKLRVSGYTNTLEQRDYFDEELEIVKRLDCISGGMGVLHSRVGQFKIPLDLESLRKLQPAFDAARAARAAREPDELTHKPVKRARLARAAS